MSAFNPAGLCAVWRRQLASLLGNPLAYVFIFAFVLVTGGYMFLLVGDKGDGFFVRNIDDLGLLQPFMPWALAVLLPALAMGAWSSERESGTEELLLTLPMSTLDAILGKYLAITTYFTIALACSAARDLAVLEWLGDPDLGLFFANYLGWWLAGLAFGAFGLFASTLVAMPAISFVLGVVFCAVLMVLITAVEALSGHAWFDGFNRGVISLGDVVVALAVVAAGLAASVAMIASRRWRPGSEKLVLQHVLTLVFGVGLAVNLAGIAHKFGADADVSAERLSSLATQSAQIVANIAEPVTIAAFISKDLPPALEPKRKEIEDKLAALQRASRGKITVERFYPEDELDDKHGGTLATKQYGLKTRKEIVATPNGQETQSTFLSAAVTSGGRTQLIEYFDPGLSVEYELVRAVRTVAVEKKHVLGVAQTDVQMMGGFDFSGGAPNQSPSWQMVEEWKRQYDVQEVNLDSPVAKNIEVLVVAEPSSLTDAQLRNLHDYVWNGGPTLLLEDPAPIGPGAQLAPSQPKKSAGGPFGQQENAPKKGDLKPLMKSLGVEFDENQIVWSDYNPSHMYREMIPPNLVWARDDQKGSLNPDAPITQGLRALLLPYPGDIRISDSCPASIHVQWLAKPILNAKCGLQPFSDHFRPNMFGGLQQVPPNEVPPPRRFVNPDMPLLAVEITGRMPSAYPEVDPAAAAAEKDKKDDAAKAEDKKDDAAKPGEKKDDAAKADKPEEKKPEPKVGVQSPKDIHVVLVSDLDLIHDWFFNFYRNAGKKFSADELKFLLEVRNIPFIANAVDALAGDQDFLALRSRHARLRPLERLEEVRLKTEERRQQRQDDALDEFDKKKAEAQAAFDAKLAKIDAQTDLDEIAKANQKEQVRDREQRNLEQQIDVITQKKDQADEEAKIDQRRTIEAERRVVRWLVIFIPGAILLVLTLFVFVQRVARERSHIPASRKRSMA